jgi:hypothetical protein
MIATTPLLTCGYSSSSQPVIILRHIDIQQYLPVVPGDILNRITGK